MKLWERENKNIYVDIGADDNSEKYNLVSDDIYLEAYAKYEFLKEKIYIKEE